MILSVRATALRERVTPDDYEIVFMERPIAAHP